MATRSYIGVKINDDQVLAVYCHWDGYPEHHMPLLTSGFETHEKALELVRQGDMSELGGCLADCVFYVRDRGDDMNRCKPALMNVREFTRKNLGEYCYLFADGKWS